jgi:hypothetical protein
MIFTYFPKYALSFTTLSLAFTPFRILQNCKHSHHPRLYSNWLNTLLSSCSREGGGLGRVYRNNSTSRKVQLQCQKNSIYLDRKHLKVWGPMLQLVKSIGKSDTEFHQYRKQAVYVQLVAKHRENRPGVV